MSCNFLSETWLEKRYVNPSAPSANDGNPETASAIPLERLFCTFQRILERIQKWFRHGQLWRLLAVSNPERPFCKLSNRRVELQ